MISSIAGKIRRLLSTRKFDERFFGELEEILIEGDVGGIVTREIVDSLQGDVRRRDLKGRADFILALKVCLSGYLKTDSLHPVQGKLNVFLVLGVNGVGKTTTLAKLAHYYRRGLDDRVVLAAGDTFRAAAIDQLVLWGERLRLPVIRQAAGADPGAVIFDAISSARANGIDLVLADTAGRMHTKAHLVKELGKIDKIVGRKIENGQYKKILVLDATTGQNALHQAEIFHDAVGVDSIILAKYDSTAKGGIVLAISRTLGLPISFVGTGENPGDLLLFNSDSFLDQLLAE
ncbi:MAG TPA: signal recognition particle-docking protein FtsY [bacterium]|nr:signal recognition particle-docking protein FtsY [bacterium]